MTDNTDNVVSLAAFRQQKEGQNRPSPAPVPPSPIFNTAMYGAIMRAEHTSDGQFFVTLSLEDGMLREIYLLRGYARELFLQQGLATQIGRILSFYSRKLEKAETPLDYAGLLEITSFSALPYAPLPQVAERVVEPPSLPVPAAQTVLPAWDEPEPEVRPTRARPSGIVRAAAAFMAACIVFMPGITAEENGSALHYHEPAASSILKGPRVKFNP